MHEWIKISCENARALWLYTSNRRIQKKAIREIVKKLKLRRIELKKELKEECDVIKREALKDSIKIIKRQIKKGKDILDA